jgi:hypothetical protein
MVELSSLLLPILLSAVLVFIVSSVLHMALKYHHAGLKRFANEDEVAAAMRKGQSGPGVYHIPFCIDHKQLATPEYQKKFEEGPVGLITLRPTGKMSLGPFLVRWFLYSIVVSFLAAYLAQATLSSGASYLAVFRVVGVSAWLAYAWQAPANAIWKGTPWSATVVELFDGLIYALVTAGCFAWLWPR